jgi:protein required for attachment to host cells
MKKKITWIIVADGSRARFLANDGPGKGLHAAIAQEFHHETPPTRELGTEKPGRTAPSVGTNRSALQPHVDWHQFEKDKFSQEMANLLNSAAEKKSFDNLIIVAPPRTLGTLRSALSTHTSERIRAEIAKDLTQVPLQDMPEHLKEVIAL